MGWLRLVGSLKSCVSFAEYHLFYRAFFAKETYNLIDPTDRSHLIGEPYITNACTQKSFRVLMCVAVCCSVLLCVAVCCSVSQCVAVCCSVSQCVAVCRSALHTEELQGTHTYIRISQRSLILRCRKTLEYSYIHMEEPYITHTYTQKYTQKKTIYV